MNKISHLQSLRAAAAVLVVWAHAIDLASRRQLEALQLDGGFIENFGAVGVDIFFVISGFIVSLSVERATSPLQFLFRRAIRIWPLYALATIIIFAINQSEWKKLDHLIYSLLFLQVPGAPKSMPTHPLGWSLFYEVAFYLMLATSMLWRTPRPIGERVLCIFAVTLCLGSMVKFQQPLNIYGNPIIVEFALGIWMGIIWKKTPILPQWIVRGLFFLGVVFLVRSIYFGFDLISEAEYTLNALYSWERVKIWGIPSAMIVASAVFRPQTPSKNSVSVFLGDASYSIYLFSLPALWAFDLIWPLFDGISVDIIIIFATLVASLVGILFYWVLERPLMRFLDHRKSVDLKSEIQHQITR